MESLSAWRYLTTKCPVPNDNTFLSAAKGLARAPNAHSDNNAAVPQVFPVTSGGTVYYLNPSSGQKFVGGAIPINVPLAPLLTAVGPQVVPNGSIATPRTETTAITAQDLAQWLASSRKNHLPEWKLAQYNGDISQWPEWFGQFKSAIDSTPVTDVVEMTYLKILVTGRAKTEIAEMAYCATMYKGALKTIEWNFAQPHAVVSAYLDTLSHFQPLKIHNFENLIRYSAKISNLVGAFRSLHCHPDLSSASFLGQVTQTLPQNVKKA